MWLRRSHAPAELPDGPAARAVPREGGGVPALQVPAPAGREGKGAWAVKMSVPFAELGFKPIQINTIRCAPIVTFNFGGLGRDLPVSWEGALPCLPAGWGELVVDIE